MKKLSEKQKIFNKVYRHLIKQNKQSIAADGGACLYRGPNGLRCAIGCLITNEEYTPNMEAGRRGGGNVFALHESKLLPKRLWKHVGLLRNLQVIHDSNPPKNWIQELNSCATREELSIPNVK